MTLSPTIGFVFAVISLFLMFLTYCVEVAWAVFSWVSTNSWANDMFANFYGDLDLCDDPAFNTGREAYLADAVG